MEVIGPFLGIASHLFGKRGLEDGERLCDALHNLFSCFGVAEAKQHGFCYVSPPGSQTAQHLLQFVTLSAEMNSKYIYIFGTAGHCHPLRVSDRTDKEPVLLFF